MSNWVLFNNTAVHPVPLSINLDMVKIMITGTVPNTLSLDGVLVVGSLVQLMLMTQHTVYPGVAGSAITSA